MGLAPFLFMENKVFLIKIDAWMGPPRGVPLSEFKGVHKTFHEFYFTFLPLHEALALIKEQEGLFIKYWQNAGHTWSITGINEISIQETAFATYSTQVDSIRENMKGLQAMEITREFNTDWLERNKERIEDHKRETL